MEQPIFLPLKDRYRPPGTSEQAARDFCEILARRRSVRQFSPRPVSQEAIEWLVRAACSAPSGANKQPWRFVCVSDPDLKAQIRRGAEQEEREFYQHRASDSWLRDLAPLGTDEDKEYLEIAPWLIVVFKATQSDDGGKVYYAEESVGIATGMLLAAAQHAGLATLTHTPSPMRFLGEILQRPSAERPWMLIPVGYPAEDCQVPAHAMQRRPLRQSMIVNPAPKE